MNIEQERAAFVQAKDRAYCSDNGTFGPFEAFLAGAEYARAQLQGQKPVELSAAVREYLQDAINSATQCEDGDTDFKFADEIAVLLNPLYAAPVAAQPVQELPGMWEEADLSGGETDCIQPVQLSEERIKELAALLESKIVVGSRGSIFGAEGAVRALLQGVGKS